jgi:hypothetical protein
MSEWVKCSERLPETVWNEDGSVNSVLIYHKNGFECGEDIQVSNTVCARDPLKWGHTHWMKLPDPPTDFS